MRGLIAFKKPKYLLASFIIIGTVIGILQSYALDGAQARDRQKSIIILQKEIKDVKEAANASDAQKAYTIDQLQKQVDDLKKQLQSKVEREARIASVSRSGYGGNYSGNFGFQNGYAWGNCTWFIASIMRVPDNLGNASSWDEMARADGYIVSDVPKIGSVAQTDAGYYGHVAYVEDTQNGIVLLKEMNVVGLGAVDERWVTTSDYRYIYF